jgi:cytochrome P450
VPGGTNVLILPNELHTDKSVWGEDALQFNPERFTDENFKNIHPYAFLPFSNGPRICPGFKYAWIVMKVFLSRFLMKYRVTTSLKFEDLKLHMQITTELKPHGALMKVERR